MLTWVPGRTSRTKCDYKKQAANSGRLLARLHKHATSWDPPDGLVVPIADRVSYLGDEPVFEALARSWGLYLEAQDRAQRTIDAIWNEAPVPPTFSMAISPSTTRS